MTNGGTRTECSCCGPSVGWSWENLREAPEAEDLAFLLGDEKLFGPAETWRLPWGAGCGARGSENGQGRGLSQTFVQVRCSS